MSKRQVIIFLAAAALFPALSASAQTVGMDLPEAERRARCQTNKQQRKELMNEAFRINEILVMQEPEYWTEEQLARARAHRVALGYLKQSLGRRGRKPDPGDVAKLSKIMREQDYTLDHCLQRAANRPNPELVCAQEMEAELVRSINVAVANSSKRAEFHERHKEVGRQIEVHCQRMSELGCKELTGEDDCNYTGPSNEGAKSESNYKGCFLDNNTSERPRDLNGHYWTDKSMTVEACVASCREKNFSFAAVQYGSHCFCGNDYGRYGALDGKGARRCDTPCSGDPARMCGGAWANSVYSTAEGQ
jgi:hypothetical protein